MYYFGQSGGMKNVDYNKWNMTRRPAHLDHWIRDKNNTFLNDINRSLGAKLSDVRRNDRNKEESVTAIIT